jgi:2-dehydro-3-deoxygalactonokinase
LSYIITIDSGTTNSRFRLWEKEKYLVKAEISVEIGVRNTSIDGNNSKLKNAIKKSIQAILSQNHLSINNIKAVIASGMITSSLGLYELPHLTAPAGITELSRGMKNILIKDVCQLPLWFIPGIKNKSGKPNIKNINSFDMMRGEETEAVGLINMIKINKPFLAVFPGTHTKFVSINGSGKITGCLTSIAGELVSAITTNTLLSSSLNNSLVKKINIKYLIAGFKEATEKGFIKSLFSIRILDILGGIKGEKSANYLLGAILAEDIRTIKKSKSLKINNNLLCVISGKEILEKSFKKVFKFDNYFKNIITISSYKMRNLSGFGAIKIAENRGII